MERRFRDRQDAGARLAEAVAALGLADPVILGLPRGGVPVAAPVAEALGAPLDIALVRKIGCPGREELAAGALAESGEVVRNADVIRGLGLSDDDLAPVIEKERRVIAERAERYRGDRPPVALAGRDAVIVDDGIATGATLRAALKGVRAQGPSSVTVAVPVAPEEAEAEFRGAADHWVCLSVPRPFIAVGAHYDRFDQTTDDDVLRALDDARGRGQGGTP